MTKQEHRENHGWSEQKASIERRRRLALQVTSPFSPLHTWLESAFREQSLAYCLHLMDCKYQTALSRVSIVGILHAYASVCLPGLGS